MNPLLKDIFAQSRRVVDLGTEKNLTFATAESCTGGLLGAAITSMSGASTVFKGGIIAYDNAVKTAQLSVSDAILAAHGAVSAEVAYAMAENARKILDVDIALSVTGIAGPGGGSPEKPVGTVWMGLSRQNMTETRLLQLGEIGRNKIRDMTVLEALKWLGDVLR